VTVTLQKYDNAILMTRKLQLVALSNVDEGVANIAAYNMRDSLDSLVSPILAAGTHVIRMNSGVVKSDMLTGGAGTTGAITAAAADTFTSKIPRLATAKFVPAVHNHQPVIAIFYGTVKFAVVNGKPRLRIFANQQLNELDKETDYIDPQPYVGQDSKFTGLHYPDTGSSVAVTGVVELALNVDAKGNLKDIQVLSEEPPLLGFGDAARSDFDGARFIPAFRNGQPVESNVKIPVYYKPSA